MKLLAQHMRTGETLLLDIPTPLAGPGTLLIRTRKTLVSRGTEHSLIQFSKSTLLNKALDQPERARQFLEKIKSEGLASSVRQAVDKLSQVLPLGYSNVGEVIEIGADVRGFQIGDRVVSNGPHAEVVCVGINLAAKIPDHVTDEEAAFTVLGAVGLQGIRLLAPALGETVVVFGLGLIGLLTAELLLRNGCRVIGIEPNETKRALAESKGVNTIDPDSIDCARKVLSLTSNVGADGVIITASDPGHSIIAQSARMTRIRGKIVLIGSVGLHLDRADFYRKEITFQVSCSYGPGRYNDAYEQHGVDYPLPFVRWTENRNFQAILHLLANKALDVIPLISERLPVTAGSEIYSNKNPDSIATIIEYPGYHKSNARPETYKAHFDPAHVIIGIIGAGNFTRQTLLPNLDNRSIKYISSAKGISAERLGKKYNIPFKTCNYRELLDDKEIDLVIITTRHNTHAQLTIDTLNGGKHVFVEKPLALTRQELEAIKEAYNPERNKETSITVGFNRRFSPHVATIKELLGTDPSNIIITVNAANHATDTWLDDPLTGGGRILGEACHFIDLAAYIAGSRIDAVCMTRAGRDDANILLRFGNGSSAAIHYFTNGHRGHSKERIEVYSLGRTLILDDFKTLKGYGFKKFNSLSTYRSKGHKEQFQSLLERLKTGGGPLIPFEEIVNSTSATLAAEESFALNAWVNVI